MRKRGLRRLPRLKRRENGVEKLVEMLDKGVSDAKKRKPYTHFWLWKTESYALAVSGIWDAIKCRSTVYRR